VAGRAVSLDSGFVFCERVRVRGCTSRGKTEVKGKRRGKRGAHLLGVCGGSKRGEGAGGEGRTASRRARVRERYWLASTIASLSVTLEKSGSAELFVDAARRECKGHVDLHGVVRGEGRETSVVGAVGQSQ
jgi:hypothetical protein